MHLKKKRKDFRTTCLFGLSVSLSTNHCHILEKPFIFCYCCHIDSLIKTFNFYLSFVILMHKQILGNRNARWWLSFWSCFYFDKEQQVNCYTICERQIFFIHTESELPWIFLSLVSGMLWMCMAVQLKVIPSQLELHSAPPHWSTWLARTLYSMELRYMLIIIILKLISCILLGPH